MLCAWTINPLTLSSDKIDLIRTVNISFCCAEETDVTIPYGEEVVIGGTLPWIGVSKNDADVCSGIDMKNRKSIEYHIFVLSFSKNKIEMEIYNLKN